MRSIRRGMVGLGAVAGCRLQGAARIVCVDLSEERLELARGQGATETLVGGPDVVAQIVEMTDGFGADYTFEATGNVGVMRQAVESARMGWGFCTVAGVAGKGETLDIVPRFLITGRRVAGSSFGGVKGRDQVPEFVERWLAGDIDVEPFLSHSLTLDEVNRGFRLMEEQDGIRSVIKFAEATQTARAIAPPEAAARPADRRRLSRDSHGGTAYAVPFFARFPWSADARRHVLSARDRPAHGAPRVALERVPRGRGTGRQRVLCGRERRRRAAR